MTKLRARSATKTVFVDVEYGRFHFSRPLSRRIGDFPQLNVYLDEDTPSFAVRPVKNGIIDVHVADNGLKHFNSRDFAHTVQRLAGFDSNRASFRAEITDKIVVNLNERVE